jgi:hypothetical protein
MAESAKTVVSKLPVRGKGIEENQPGDRPYFVHRLAAHQVATATPPKCDVLVLNRYPLSLRYTDSCVISPALECSMNGDFSN